MTIVGVHGIGKYKYFEEASGSVSGAATLMLGKWNDYLHKGLGGTRRPYVTEIAYYAHHLRKGPPRPPRKMEPPEKLVFTAWMDQLDARLKQSAGDTVTGLAHRLAQWLIDRLGDRALTFAEDFCPEVATYLGGGDPRTRARDAVADTIRRNKPTVVIAHSLGSVVTYEALWAHPDLRTDLLITLGSPLGMRNVVFERLAPLPVAGFGARPPGVKRWINIADKHDIAAIPTGLRDRFRGVERDIECDIDWLDFHTVRNYLACAAVNEHIKPLL